MIAHDRRTTVLGVACRNGERRGAVEEMIRVDIRRLLRTSRHQLGRLHIDVDAEGRHTETVVLGQVGFVAHGKVFISEARTSPAGLAEPRRAWKECAACPSSGSSPRLGSLSLGLV